MRGVEAAWTRQDGSGDLFAKVVEPFGAKTGRSCTTTELWKTSLRRREMKRSFCSRRRFWRRRRKRRLMGFWFLTGRLHTSGQPAISRMWNEPRGNRPHESCQEDDGVRSASSWHSAAFLQRVEYLNVHETEKMNDEVELKDGRVLERILLPFRILPESSTAESGIFAISRAQTSGGRACPPGYRDRAIRRSRNDYHYLRRNRVCQPGLSRITGYSREEALGQNPRILKSGNQDPEFYQELWAAILKAKSGMVSSSTGERTAASITNK